MWTCPWCWPIGDLRPHAKDVEACGPRGPHSWMLPMPHTPSTPLIRQDLLSLSGHRKAAWPLAGLEGAPLDESRHPSSSALGDSEVSSMQNPRVPETLHPLPEQRQQPLRHTCPHLFPSPLTHPGPHSGPTRGTPTRSARGPQKTEETGGLSPRRGRGRHTMGPESPVKSLCTPAGPRVQPPMTPLKVPPSPPPKIHGTQSEEKSDLSAT